MRSRPRHVDWEHEWSRVWKPDAANVWFRYLAGVYAGWVGPVAPDARVLKTDAFDEACGFEPLVSPHLVLMDVAPRILTEALRRRRGARGCVTDVRRLAFRDGAFDYVFSSSTLDHFDSADDIDVALAELARVLRPGGTLLVTLDNPANPILRLRYAIRRRTGLGRLAPYAAAQTLSLHDLVAAAQRAGLAVVARGFAVHAPRIVGLWLGEWAAHRLGRSARLLQRLFDAVERRAGRLPTRRLTGHYVVVTCRRLPPAPHVPRPVIGFGDTGAGVVAWKRAEARLRSIWRRRVPTPVLAVLDPPLRRAVAMVRRAAAVPVYLRQPLGVYVGSCAGATTRVVLWGKPGSPIFLPALLFDGPPTITWQNEPRRLRDVLRDTASLDADLLIAETTPALARLFRRRGFLVVPEQVRFAASTEALRSVAEHPSKSIESDERVVRRARYRVRVRPYTTELGRRYFDEYILPFAVSRFETDARLPDFQWFDLMLQSGFVIELLAPDGDEPVAVAFDAARGRVLSFVSLGTRRGDLTVHRAGAMHALYEATRALAAEHGCTSIDAGRCRPWRQDGIAKYKWKHGYRPIVDGAQTLEHAVRVLRPESPVARRLAEAGLLVRVGGGIRVLQRDGTLGAQ